MLAIIVGFFVKLNMTCKKALSIMFFFRKHYSSTPIYKENWKHLDPIYI